MLDLFKNKFHGFMKGSSKFKYNLIKFFTLLVKNCIVHIMNKNQLQKKNVAEISVYFPI